MVCMWRLQDSSLESGHSSTWVLGTGFGSSALSRKCFCPGSILPVYVLSMSTIWFLYWLPIPPLCAKDCQANIPHPRPDFILPLIPCDVNPTCEALCLCACLSSYHCLPLEAGHCLTIARALSLCKRRGHLLVPSSRKKRAPSLSHCSPGVHMAGSA